MITLLGIFLILVSFWLYMEVENAPLEDEQGNYEYKDYFTIFGIKLFKNPRKNK